MKKTLWFALVVLLGGCPVVGRTEDGPAGATGRAVRLSFVQGDVTADRADNIGAVALPMNSPLPEGTRLITGSDGQAEVEFEDGSVVRLTPNSELSLDKLGLEGQNYKTAMTVKSGLAYAELRATEQYGYVLTADEVTMRPVENSTVRVNMDAGAPVFAVMDGRIRVAREPDYKTEISGHETLSVDTADASRYMLTKQVTDDSWDRWNEERDQAAANEAATRTVARDEFAGERGDGWSDLDANGNWYETPEGRAWQPAIANDYGFDPYGYGSWVWYGTDYQWISGYNWGWVPYHCGRWVYMVNWGWVWYPNYTCRRWNWNGGVVVDLTGAPRGYNPIRKPVGNPIKGPGGIHPIGVIPVGRGDGAKKLPGHAGPIHTVVADATNAKTPMHRLEPITGYAPHGGSAIGAPFRRDFPIGGQRLPVMGTAPEDSQRRRNEPTMIAPQPGDPASRRVEHVPVQPGQSVPVRPVDRAPINVPDNTRAKAPRPVQSPPEHQAPVQQPHYQPAPQPQPRYEPPPQRPHYQPPPQQSAPPLPPPPPQQAAPVSAPRVEPVRPN